MPWPKWDVEYGVMPQTYMRTRGGSIGRNSSLRPVSVLWTLIGGSCSTSLSSAVRLRRVRGRAVLSWTALETGAAQRGHNGSIIAVAMAAIPSPRPTKRSEEHTSELQSRLHLVCRLL